MLGRLLAGVTTGTEMKKLEWKFLVAREAILYLNT